MSSRLKTALSRNLRRERSTRGFSQEQLADACGLHRTYIGGIERCERNITVSTLERIATALGIDPIALLKDIEE